MSEFQQQLESILVADCGRTATKVVLLDMVSGQYRFVAFAEAPSTIQKPWEDISVGVVDAIRQLETLTGRTFLDSDGQLVTPELGDGKGVDRFVAISSAAEPLRVILSGLVRDVSLSSARRAALSTYSTIVDVISLEQAPGQNGPRTEDAKINAIWHEVPDVVCVVGGTDGGAAAPVWDMVKNVVYVALYLMGEAAPPVIYAGNARLQDKVVQSLQELVPVQAVSNVRPFPDAENIGPAYEEMEVLFYEKKLGTMPGGEVLGGWTLAPILPTARAADYFVRFCERVWKSLQPALGVDVGSASVSLNVCWKGVPLTTIRTDLGVGVGLPGVLDQVDMDDILRWLPFSTSETQVRDRLLNRSLRPYSIPQTREDLLLEQAVAREALRLTLRDSLPAWPNKNDDYPGMIPACQPIIASGRCLARAPGYGYAALMLLDALQPIGTSTLYLDERNLVPSLGAAGIIEPLVLVQGLRNDGLTYLGTVIVPLGPAKDWQSVLTIKPLDKESNINVEVTQGSVVAFPFESLAPGTELELIPSWGIDVGAGPGKRMTIRYDGGAVGLMVDARGRPLDFGDGVQSRQQRVSRWLRAMAGT